MFEVWQFVRHTYAGISTASCPFIRSIDIFHITRILKSISTNYFPSCASISLAKHSIHIRVFATSVICLYHFICVFFKITSCLEVFIYLPFCKIYNSFHEDIINQFYSQVLSKYKRKKMKGWSSQFTYRSVKFIFF